MVDFLFSWNLSQEKPADQTKKDLGGGNGRRKTGRRRRPNEMGEELEERR